MTPIKARDKEHLKLRIQVDVYGNECDLNHINISGVNNISDLFFGNPFDGDISSWVIRQVQDQRVFSRLHHSPLDTWTF